MIITSEISLREYIKLLLKLTYKKPVMWLLIFVACVMLAWIISYYNNLLPVPEPTYYQFVTLGLITVVQPLVIFFMIKKNYNSSNHLKERLLIGFGDQEIKITGDSFYMELNWSKIYKVVELKKWFLIYQNNLSAILVPVKSFDEEQLSSFKKMLLSIPGLSVRLRD
ncbi:MAG: YcxB family protein [Bacteroidota bacterium]